MVKRIKDTLHDPKIEKLPEDLVRETYRKDVGTELLILSLALSAITGDQTPDITKSMQALLEAMESTDGELFRAEYVVFHFST